MTIAACYVSPEGVVLGADSTSTYRLRDGAHYFNHAQKIFEVGTGSTFGVVTWGLGGLNVSSHRRLLATFADDLGQTAANSIQHVAERWVEWFFAEYERSDLIVGYRDLASKLPFDPRNPFDAANRTQEEEKEYSEMKSNLGVGFCIGGYHPSDRSPTAYHVWFDPDIARPQPIQQAPGFNFWGAPNMIQRLVFGHDGNLKSGILRSGRWKGTEEELDEILQQQVLSHPILPIRDAIDFVHSCILSTIKALKFSDFQQICGGPVELAVITADRPFRWVRHKEWDSALLDGAP